PIPISNELYQELLYKKKNNNFIDNDNKNLLNNSLYIKLCHCIKKIFLKNKFLKNIFNIKRKYNEYPICINSIYKKRNFKPPTDSKTKCYNNFNWYKLINDINKRKTKSKTKKKKHKGGEIMYNSNIGPVIENGFIGPTPPNKLVIKDNTQIACFNDFIKHPASQWPNRYECPDRRCDYWAGKRKKSSLKKKIKNKLGGNCNKCTMKTNLANCITNDQMENKALPTNSGKFNQLNYGKQLAKGLQGKQNNTNWNTWMKNHNNFWWASN
ncbi:unnamed protein product, partial [marine sediment metagenome]